MRKNNLEVIEETDEKKCHVLWQQFTFDESIFDRWEMRYSVQAAYHYPLHFKVVYKQKKPVAFLPLWYSPDKKKYEFFGGLFPEENSFYCHDKNLIPELINLIPTPAELCAISPKRMPYRFDSTLFKQDYSKYILHLDKKYSFDELLQRFDKKARYNIRSAYTSLMEYNPQIEYIHDLKQFTHYLKILEEMSIARFTDPSDMSSFADPREAKGYIELFKMQSNFEIGIWVVKIHGKVAAVDLVAWYKNRYYMFTGANDLERYPGIGMFMVYIEFEDAMRRGATSVDCLQGDFGWKHRYFTEEKLLKVEK